jgi:formylglycine-generating enzyme required for sulfatase activity
MRAVAVAALLGMVACGSELPAEGQVLLYVNTDAPLPPPPGETARVPPLFDRLRFEIFPAGASEPCAGCSREIGVDASLLAAGRASIGIVPPAGERGHRVRVRLFRSGGTASGEPRPASTLEKVVELPEISSEGVVEATVVLWTDDVARPVGSLGAPVAPEPGAAVPGLVGTWNGAARVACAGEPGPAEACLPGGAFWMGDPTLRLDETLVTPLPGVTVAELQGGRERLVVLSPFFLDVREVTVAEIRASGVAKSLVPGGLSDDPHEAGQGIADCTYTSSPGPLDDRPVSCVTWGTAAAFCKARGKHLPSDAELEYAMSGLGASRYVWGDEPPRCSDAIFARGKGDACENGAERPAIAGSAERDRLSLGAASIVDLAGNLKEWPADTWNHESEGCWQASLVFDPLCTTPSALVPQAHALRGGDWADPAVGLRAAVRTFVVGDLGVSGQIGFRCARDGR